VTSDVPDWSYEELERAGDDYDEELVERYGTPRSETPDRVHDLTDELVDGQSTPYAEAVAIEHWLKNEKEYTLDTPQPGDDVVDEFIFEMEAGYCVYFAASMTEMLRTQGVPARYVTGYARGTTEDGVEEVTADRAHAWVEVYIEDVGWVTFDPTPPEREEARSNGDEATFTYDDVATTVQHAENGDDWETVDADVELLSDPTPGTEGEVRVTRGGDPLVDHRVSFNGEVAGMTDENGDVTGTLPYTERLDVTVEEYVGTDEPDEEDAEDQTGDEADEEEESTDEEDEGEEADDETAEDDGEEADDQGADEEDEENGDADEDLLDGELGEDAADPDERRIEMVDAREETTIGGPVTELPTTTVFTVDHDDTDTDTSSVESSSRVFASGAAAGLGGFEVANTDGGIPLNTDLELTFSETPLLPGSDAEVTATIDGNPVPNAEVSAGDVETTTDADGVATIQVPYSETLHVEASRGEATGETTSSVATDVSLSTPEAPAAGTDVTVEATADDRPVEGLDVLIDGVAVGETDENGIAGVPVGYEETVEVVAMREDVRGSETIAVNTDLDVQTDGIPFPGTSVTLTATVDGEPIADATVTTDDTETTTDANGTAAVGIPTIPQSEVRYHVQRGDAAAEGVVGLTGVWATILGAALLGGLIVKRRANPRATGRRALGNGRRLVSLLTRLPRATVSALIRVAVWVGRMTAQGGRGMLLTSRALLATFVAAVRRVVIDLPRTVASLVSSVGVYANRLFTRAVALVVWFAVGPRTWLDRFRAWRASDAAVDGPSHRSSGPNTAGAGEVSGDGERSRIDPRVVVIRAWNWLVGVVRPRSSMTPREIADRAIDLGLPEGHVRRVLEGFRSLRYANRPPSQEEAETVAESEQTLRSARGGDE